jgi:hypothetical protein
MTAPCPKGKVQFATMDGARIACAAISKRAYLQGRKFKEKTGQKPERVKVRVYICPECGQWHVGRGAKGKDADWNTRKIAVLDAPDITTGSLEEK